MERSSVAANGPDIEIIPNSPTEFLIPHDALTAADWEDFPPRPTIDGTDTLLPAATMAALRVVAPCASTCEKRHVLQGVFFSPE